MEETLEGLLSQLYKEDNYQIIDYDNSSIVTVVYFSSNGLYFPNTLEEARERLVNQNRYEWQRNRIPNVRREIYVRDIYKCWYVKGINERICSLKKLKEFLSEQVYVDGDGNSNLIFVGNSAGGYAAALFGTMLGASKIYDFAGQNSLWVDGIQNEFVKQMSTDIENAKYYDLNEFWNNNSNDFYKGELYYFYSAGDELDQKMYELISNQKFVVGIGFNTKRHAETMYRFNLGHFLALDAADIQKMSKRFGGKRTSRLYFSIYNFGIYTTVREIIRKFKGK